jgi:hypothetical protein
MTAPITPTEELRDKILDKLPCRDIHCDGHGTTMDGNDQEVWPAQCQYCFEVSFPLADELMALFEQFATRRVIEELKSIKRHIHTRTVPFAQTSGERGYNEALSELDVVIFAQIKSVEASLIDGKKHENS